MEEAIIKENSIEAKRPDLAEDWAFEMNAGKDPRQIALHDNRKYFWNCKNGHTYLSSPDKRARGSGCPYCSNRKLLRGYNDLSTRFPEFANEWDKDENKGLPDDYTIISAYSAKWICSKCGFRWSAKIRDRVNSKYGGCPKCAIRIRGQLKHETALVKNGGIKDELLLKEWDCERNEKGPECYTPQSNAYAYWICSVCGYKYRAKISNRTNGRGCACCAGKKVVVGKNDLASVMPDLAREWDSEKNGDLTPEMVTAGCGKKVWWQCPNGHSYNATVLHRAYGTKCPICNSGRQTSFAEQAVFFYLKQLYPDAINRYKADFLERLELDIYIPSIGYGIEYDGVAWHKKDKIEREIKKYRLCKENGIKLIRLREENLEQSIGIYNCDRAFGCEELYQYKNLSLVIDQLLTFLNFSSIGNPVIIDLEKDKYQIYSFTTELREHSLADDFPMLAKEWDYDKNGGLKPTNVKPHSDIVVWWKCSECEHGFRASISHRSYGTGCPKCAIKKSTISRSLPVVAIDPNTNEVVTTFASISEAARQMGLTSSNITMVCKGVRKHTGGLKWKYAGEEKH